MKHSIGIHFENNLVIERRDITVYHHHNKGTHLISHGSSIHIPLETEKEKDYIYLSVAVGPGYMERQNIVDLPTWINYEFISEGKFAAIRSEHRTLLKIPAGLPEWKLKLTLPASHCKPLEGRIIVSDDQGC
jgi:hypothetical protein